MILQALNRHYERLHAQGRAPAHGFSVENVSYAIVLSAEGLLVDVLPLSDASEGKLRPLRELVPQAAKRASNVCPNFLWDKTEYALGVTGDTKKNSARIVQCHAAFKEFHRQMLQDAEDAGLRALLLFLERWDPCDYHNIPHAEDMRSANVVFRLDGQQAFLHGLPAAQAIWENYIGQTQELAGASPRACLVTGQPSAIARLHPPIKGLGDPSAQSSGVNIVSFNWPASTSFGKLKGENAPVSQEAAFGYTTALNTLMSRTSGHKLRIADATVVFWAEVEQNTAEEAESLVAWMLDPQRKPDDEEEAAKVGDLLRKIAEGQPINEVAPDINPGTPFYVLGLAPNAARLSVRYWQTTSVGGVFDQIVNHWRDMRMDPPAWQSPPAVWRLLRETAAQRESKNISPVLGGALMRSILTGAPYPRSLLSAVITRFRADGKVTPLRVALVKACVRRAERLKNPDQEDTLMSLDPSSPHAAYNLGRLFAAYAYAEKSNSAPNATIRDKYMGTASANPRRVFPTLMRGYEHNRAGLLKKHGNKAGAGVRADKAVGEILGHLPGAGELPATLSLEDQGRFFIGYYHQEQAFYTKAVPDPTVQSDLEE